MIITRTPLRVSFVGGGTDFEEYYSQHGGEVISATINKYIYVTVNRKFDGKIHVRYADVECVSRIDDLKHHIAREALRLAGVERGVEIAIISDVPAHGSGLGSSSALAVGLLQALFYYMGNKLSPRGLAELASALEIQKLHSPIGRQDQYAAAYGGLNHIKFLRGGRPDVVNLNLSARLGWLGQACHLFYLNGRDANGILAAHKMAIPQKEEILKRQKNLVVPFAAWLAGEGPENALAGDLVSQSWAHKKAMTPQATNSRIDKLIKDAMNAGALGAKVCGAGAGGFLLVICEPSRAEAVRQALPLAEMKFDFENNGATIIYAE